MIRLGKPQSKGASPFRNKWTIGRLFQILHSAQYARESRAYFGARGMEIATGSHIHIRDNIGMRQNCSARKTGVRLDRKSTRLNSSHANISYAVFCLKKKKE